MKDGDIIIVNDVEYKLTTVRGRSKFVSKNGDLINPKKRNQKCTLTLNRDGYLCSGGSIPVHLYVGHAWVDGYFDGAEINHKDFDRTNNNYTNLEWVSHQDNIKHSMKYNKNVWHKCKLGENNGRSVFTKEQISEIRNLYKSGMSVFDIIRHQTNLTNYDDIKKVSSRYYCVVNNKTWSE
jgi:hypothetical protein